MLWIQSIVYLFFGSLYIYKDKKIKFPLEYIFYLSTLVTLKIVILDFTSLSNNFPTGECF